MILPFMSLYCVHNWGGDHGHNWFCFSCRCSMITRGDGHLVGSAFSMLPFTSPCYVDSWDGEHDQCWFYFFHLFLPLLCALLRQWSVGCFDFLRLFLPILFCVFWSLSASSMTAEAVVNWLYWWLRRWSWPMLVLFFLSLCTCSMITKAMVNYDQ